MTEVDRIIHEPARLVLVALLSGVKEADFVWLQRESGLTKGNLSGHLARLEAAGYVEIEKRFRGKTPLTAARLTKAGARAYQEYKETMNGLLARARPR